MALELIDIHHRYGRRPSLSAVSMCVRPGDCYGFIGHNGAGKTTTLRVALGLMRPTSGRVLIDGFDAADFPREARARTAGMIETTGFYPWASARDNLVELGRLQGMSRRDARIEADRQLDEVGLARHAYRRVGAFSQGMRQRLGLAQALLGHPRYVLLDEPQNGLDPEGIADLRALLRRLTQDRGLTVLLSSHQLLEVADLCNRIGVLREGRLLLEQETGRLLESTRGRFELATDDEARARTVLDRLGVAHSRRGRATLSVDIGDGGPRELVRHLVAADVGVEQLTPRPTTLEEVYLRLSNGKDHDPGTAPPEVATPEPAAQNGRDGEAPAAPRAAPRAAPGRPATRLAPRWPITRMVRHELYRAARRLPVIVLVAAPALLAWWQVSQLASGYAAHLAEVAAGTTLYSTSSVTAFEAVGRGLAAGLPAALLVVVALASQSVSGDLGLGTLRNILLRPIGRRRVAAGKALAVGVAVLVVLGLLVAVSLASAAWYFDFADRLEITRGGEPGLLIHERQHALAGQAAAVWPYLEGALLAPLVPLLAYGGVGFLAGTLVRRGIWALGLALVSVLALDLGRVPARRGRWEDWLPSAYVPSPFGDTSYTKFFVDLSIGSDDAHFEYAASAFTVPALWCVATFLLAALLLAKKRVT